MGASKTTIFSDQDNRLADLAKALAHPARVAIVNYLALQKSCICKDIVEEIPLAQPTISQHLRVLKNAGLIQGSIEGTAICYCLNPEGLSELLGFGQRLLAAIACDSEDANCC